MCCFSCHSYSVVVVLVEVLVLVVVDVDVVVEVVEVDVLVEVEVELLVEVEVVVLKEMPDQYDPLNLIRSEEVALIYMSPATGLVGSFDVSVRNFPSKFEILLILNSYCNRLRMIA